jgi:hypothetical protein
MVWNDWNAALRWDSPSLNAACLLIAYLLPWLSLGLVLWRSRAWLRITSVAVLAVPLLFTMVFGPFVFQHLATVQADGKPDPISLDTVSTTMTGAKEVDDEREKAEADSWQ